MSARTFARRFVDETGTTPMQWVTDQRVLYARRLLEESDMDIDQIADRSGFGTATLLRHHFRRIIGVTPSDYRRRFACDDSAARQRLSLPLSCPPGSRRPQAVELIRHDLVTGRTFGKPCTVMVHIDSGRSGPVELDGITHVPQRLPSEAESPPSALPCRACQAYRQRAQNTEDRRADGRFSCSSPQPIDVSPVDGSELQRQPAQRGIAGTA
jgi:hypothetical protein